MLDAKVGELVRVENDVCIVDALEQCLVGSLSQWLTTELLTFDYLHEESVRLVFLEVQTFQSLNLIS